MLPFLLRCLAVTAAVVACVAAPVRAQETVVLFDEDDAAGADYRDASYGLARDGDSLLLVGPGGTRMPVEREHAFSGETSGLLVYRHVPGGAWEMNIEPESDDRFDLTGFDSLVVYLNGPEALAGSELPRIGLRDVGGAPSAMAWLSPPRNVRIDAQASGFTAGSGTNARLAASYVRVLPADERRPGYPESLLVTFADAPLDTSEAAIGVPAVPAHFEIEAAESGRRLPFRFRDVDGDHTLSADGEYVDVLTPETEGSARLQPTWRIEYAGAEGVLVPPGAGDVYQLAVAYDALSLDDDPATWQRVSVPLADLLSAPMFVPEQVWLPWFAYGGANPAVRTLWVDRIEAVRNDDAAFLDDLQRRAFDYFWQEANPGNGLVRDRSQSGSPASIAAVGFGLSAITVGIDRGWISREEGRERVLRTLRFFWNAPQSTATDATGYKGFFYHFLDMNTGRRAWSSELSTIDTALLLAGVLHARAYFSASDAAEDDIRALADSIYQRVDWTWAQVRGDAISHGWRPESGFIAADWLGYNEAMILYILALGSPTHPVEPEAWDRWVDGYAGAWQTHYGYTFLTFPPLFGHQYSHVWIDFRGIQDAYMRAKGIDYFENSRRATLAQRAYHVANPRGWPNYGRDEWGLTASDCPQNNENDPCEGYGARGAPPGFNDEGTLAPTAPGGSIAFTPDASIAALRHMRATYPGLWGPYGPRDAYNAAQNWIARDYIGIDQGPILLMAENYRTERVWDVFMQNDAIRRGLEHAGFVPVVTAAEPADEAPVRRLVHAAYPNPFRDATDIHFTLPAPGPVRLSVYDLLGKRVFRVDDVLRAGEHTATIEAGDWPSGVYVYRLEWGATLVTGTLVRIR